MAGLFEIGTDDELANMSFEDIRRLRGLFPDKASQNRLAPFDRSSDVLEQMKAGGPIAGLYGLGTPIFELLKLLSPTNMGSRSDPSFASAMSGISAFGKGLTDWNKSKVTTKVRTAGLLPYVEPELPSIATRAAPMTEFLDGKANESATMQDIIRLMKERKENKDLSVDNYLQNNGWML